MRGRKYKTKIKCVNKRSEKASLTESKTQKTIKIKSNEMK